MLQKKGNYPRNEERKRDSALPLEVRHREKKENEVGCSTLELEEKEEEEEAAKGKQGREGEHKSLEISSCRG